MKPHLLGLLLFTGCIGGLTVPAVADSAVSKTDIQKLVSEAAKYEPGQSREPFRGLEELVRQRPPAELSDVEAGLVQLLSTGGTYEAQEFACQQLGILGSKKALPALSRLLKSDQTVGIACLALTTYPPGKADSVLREALASAKGATRVQIINTIGDRRDTRAVKALAQLAHEADASIAAAALVALGKIGNERAWEVIMSVSKDASPALAPAATEATLRWAETMAQAGNVGAAMSVYEGLLAASQPIYVRRAAFDAVLRLDQEGAQARILTTLRGADPELKAVAIADVRLLPARDVSDIFAAELPKLSAQEQVWMIDSLAARGDLAASSTIGRSLDSPDAAVRLAAIEALGRVGSSWCVPLFARALPRAKGAEEHRAIETALIGLRGDVNTDDAITAALNKSSGATRAGLITILARRQGPAANTLLLAEARGADATAARSAFRALSITADAKDAMPLVECIISARDAEVRAEAAGAAAHALGQIEKPARRSELVCQALRWPQSQESRAVMLGLLPVCGDAPALAALEAATADAGSAVREAAVRALVEWPDARAWEAVVAVYRQPGRDVLRTLALRGLVRLANEANAQPNAVLIERYRQLLADAHTDAERRMILGALSGAADPRALQLALPLLENGAVRPEAEVAVKKIAEAIRARDPQAAAAALKRVQQLPKAQ